MIPECPPALADAADWAMTAVRPLWNQVDELVLINQAKVLSAFQAVGIADFHLAASTGYGYNDIGRERIEQLFATAMGADAGLVRVQFASGTHAIACGLFGALRPGDRLIAAAGRPYDTLRQVIDGAVGSLTEWGIEYLEAALTTDGHVDLELVSALIGLAPADRGVTLFIQRSRGYSLRPSLTVAIIAEIIAVAKAARPDCTIVVDNCYGEFVEETEPPEVGADLTCGSLIKNPGGGIAPTGGYVVGRRDLVERAAARLIAPGVGLEIGANLGMNRLIMQGFFLAPHVTGEALRGAQFTAALFGRLGFGVLPAYDQPRTDLVQAVELGSPEGLRKSVV